VNFSEDIRSVTDLKRHTREILDHVHASGRPVVLTVYLREYYASGDGLVRLTIDTDLRAYDQLMSARPNIWFPQPLEQPVIVERKGYENATCISDILSHFPIRSDRYSKYMTNISLSLVR
jgi:hypothetical protein